MAMRRIIRDQRLEPGSAAKYREIRKRVAKELPQLVARHQDRIATLDQFGALLKQLKDARKDMGISLADLTEITGMDRSAISKLETGKRPNPTIETLARYAEAVGKHILVSLADE